MNFFELTFERDATFNAACSLSMNRPQRRAGILPAPRAHEREPGGGGADVGRQDACPTFEEPPLAVHAPITRRWRMKCSADFVEIPRTWFLKLTGATPVPLFA